MLGETDDVLPEEPALWSLNHEQQTLTLMRLTPGYSELLSYRLNEVHCQDLCLNR